MHQHPKCVLLPHTSYHLEVERLEWVFDAVADFTEWIRFAHSVCMVFRSPWIQSWTHSTSQSFHSFTSSSECVDRVVRHKPSPLTYASVMEHAWVWHRDVTNGGWASDLIVTWALADKAQFDLKPHLYLRRVKTITAAVVISPCLLC